MSNLIQSVSTIKVRRFKRIQTTNANYFDR